MKEDNCMAFEIILEQYKDLIYHIIKRSCSRETEIMYGDDLFQEGCIALYEASVSYCEGKAATFSTFAYTLIHRRIIHYLRKINRERNHEVFSLDDNIEKDYDIRLTSNHVDDNPAKALASKWRLEAIYEFIQSLPENDQRIIMLREEANSYQEISNKLGIDKKKVDNRLSDIRRKYRKKKEEQFL